MPDDTNLKGMSSPQADLEGEGKALQQVTRETAAHTRAMQQNSRAVQDNSQAWGRLRKEQETYLDRLKNIGRVTSDITNGFGGMQQAIGGFTSKLKQSTTVTSMYERKLDAMRKGQAAYAGTMVATTGNISKALDESQKYVSAVHDSYREANKMSGKYRVETKALQQAMGDLSDRFATQIAVSGDMKGAITGMTEEALLMGKYLGTTMQDVMDSWQERLQQSTLTLDEAKNEMVRVTYQADKYAQAIGDLGDQYLKTGNIGKKEFVQMVRDVGKQFSHGTVQIDGYAAALEKVLVKSKKMKMSAQEQRGVAKGLANISKEMFTEGGKLSFMGYKASAEVRRRMERDDSFAEKQTPAMKARLLEVRKRTKGESDIAKDRMYMSILAGSNRGTGMGMGITKDLVKDKSLSREMMADAGGVGLYQADSLRELIQTGEAANTYNKAADKDDKKSKEDQTEIWKKSLEDVAKAAMAPKNVEYKIVAGIHEVKKTIEYWAKASIAASVGTQVLGAAGKGAWQLGGHLLARRAAQQAGGQVAARGGTSLLGGLLGGGGAASGTAITSGTAASASGTIGSTAAAGGVGTALGSIAAVGGSFLVGVGAGVGLSYLADKKIGKIVEKRLGKKEREGADILGEDSNLSTYLTRGKRGAVLDKVFSNKLDVGEKEMEQARLSAIVSSDEYANRKRMVKLLAQSVKNMEASERDLTLVEREKLKVLKKQLAQIKDSIKETRKAEKKMRGVEREKWGTKQGMRLESILRKTSFKEGMTEEQKAEQVAKSMGKHSLKALGNVGQSTMDQLSMLPKDVSAKFGDRGKFAAAMQDIQRRRALIKRGDYTKEGLAGMSREAQIAAYKKHVPGGRLGDIKGLSTLEADIARQKTWAARTQHQVFGKSGGRDEGDMGISGAGLPSEVTTNVKGELVFTLPGQRVVLKGAETGLAKLQHDKEKNG